MPRSMQEVHDLGRHVAHPRARCEACQTHVCPHCGNRDPKLIEDNGCEPSSPVYTLLCVARVVLGEDAFDGEGGQDPDSDGKVTCGTQWEPNSMELS